MFCEIVLNSIENNIFHKNQKSADRITKFEYFMKVVHIFQITCLKIMYYTLIFTEFEIFSIFKNALNLTIFAKIAYNVASPVHRWGDSLIPRAIQQLKLLPRAEQGLNFNTLEQTRYLMLIALVQTDEKV